MKGQTPLLFCGGYRQWNLPREDTNSDNNNSISQQLRRYKSIISNWDLANKDNKNIIIAMDDNLNDSSHKTNDTLLPNHAKPEKLIKLFQLRDEAIINNNLMIHNRHNTFHSRNISSKPDHIYSNCFNNINNVNTINTGFSDHSMITFTYSTKKNNTPPKLSFSRNKKLLNKDNLSKLFSQNTNIN